MSKPPNYFDAVYFSAGVGSSVLKVAELVQKFLDCLTNSVWL